MKIEKLNKDNIKEFVKDMKLEDAESLILNIDKSELFGIKKDDTFYLGFDSLSLVDTIAILYYNSKLTSELFYECIDFLNKILVVENHLIIEVNNAKYMSLLDEKYKCKEMLVKLELVKNSSKEEKSTLREKFIDIEINSIKYSSSKNEVYCNFVKQNIFDEKLILDLHNYFSELDVNDITYNIYEDNYEYLKSFGYKCLSKSYVIRNN